MPIIWMRDSIICILSMHPKGQLDLIIVSIGVNKVPNTGMVGL